MRSQVVPSRWLRRRSVRRQSAVDVLKIVPRDEAVERHPARHEKIDEARYKVPRSTVALDHAAHTPPAFAATASRS